MLDSTVPGIDSRMALTLVLTGACGMLNQIIDGNYVNPGTLGHVMRPLPTLNLIGQFSEMLADEPVPLLESSLSILPFGNTEDERVVLLVVENLKQSDVIGILRIA
jgi:hypothetical protein